MKTLDRLFLRSMHIYHLDEYHTTRIELNAFEAFGFDFKHYGFEVAVHNFIWVFRR